MTNATTGMLAGVPLFRGLPAEALTAAAEHVRQPHRLVRIAEDLPA